MANNTTVILCPMDCECEWLVSHLVKKREDPVGGYLFYEGEMHGNPTVVVRCLIGTVNAAVCTALAIGRYSPCRVIIQGTAGAHDISLRKNDIVVGKEVVPLMNSASPARQAGEGSDPLHWEDFGIQTYRKKEQRIDSLTRFPCDEQLVEAARTVPYTDGTVRVGTVGCADFWNREADLICHHHRTRQTDCEAMEGVAVAQVCAAFGIPMLEVRVISNNELHGCDSFDTQTAVNSQRFVYSLLERLAGSDQKE